MKVLKVIHCFFNKMANTSNLQKDVESDLIKQYATIGDSHCKSIGLRLDNPQEGRKYLKIGDNSIVSGDFIFESKEGFISIGDRTFIGGSTFISRNSIFVGNNVHIAWGGVIYDHDSHSLSYEERRNDFDNQLNDVKNDRSSVYSKDWSTVKSAPIVIKDDAWIGMNVIILKGVSIGFGSIVGAGSVVTHDVPDWTVVAGNPATIVKHLKPGY